MGVGLAISPVVINNVIPARGIRDLIPVKGLTRVTKWRPCCHCHFNNPDSGYDTPEHDKVLTSLAVIMEQRQATYSLKSDEVQLG